MLNAPAQEWYQPFFVEASAHFYYVPADFSGLLKPDPGFRAALGYEYRRFRFAVETGYTHIAGTNPLVTDVRFVPLAFKAGYALPLRWGLGAQMDLSLGTLFATTAYYDSVFSIIKQQETTSRTGSIFSGARLYGTYTFPGSIVKLYAGGGIDLLLETSGAIPLPVIEAGLSIKPFALIKPRAKRDAPLADVVFAATPDNLVVEETAQGKTIRLLNAVYFEKNSVVMIEQYRAVLDEAGERLRADPALRVTLRAYAAPFGTTEGQVAVSAARAWFCVEYYMKQYGIAEERMHIEYYGAEKSPEWKDASWESYRCVELIINVTEKE